jgi:hypothetical protein
MVSVIVGLLFGICCGLLVGGVLGYCDGKKVVVKGEDPKPST